MDDKDYLAETYASRADAEAAVTRLNDASKAHWIATASNGAKRLRETWNWQRARIVVGTLK